MSTDIDEAPTDEHTEPARAHDEPPDPDPRFSQDPVHPGSAPQPTRSAAEPDPGARPLLARDAEREFLGRWTGIQLSFVEDPQQAVQEADAFIREIAAGLLRSFEDRRSELAAGWRFASDTEQLRLALRQYRAFVGVLLPGEPS